MLQEFTMICGVTTEKTMSNGCSKVNNKADEPGEDLAGFITARKGC